MINKDYGLTGIFKWVIVRGVDNYLSINIK